jgi:hypothetical protein
MLLFSLAEEHTAFVLVICITTKYRLLLVFSFGIMFFRGRPRTTGCWTVVFSFFLAFSILAVVVLLLMSFFLIGLSSAEGVIAMCLDHVADILSWIFDGNVELVNNLLLIGNTNVSRNVLCSLGSNYRFLHNRIVVYGLLVGIESVFVVSQENLCVELGLMVVIGLLSCLVRSEPVVLEASTIDGVMSIEFVLVVVGILDIELATETIPHVRSCRQVIVKIHPVLRLGVVFRILLVSCHSCLVRFLLLGSPINGPEQTTEETSVIILGADHRVLVKFDRNVRARVGESLKIWDERRHIDNLEISFTWVFGAFGVFEFLLSNIEALVNLSLNDVRSIGCRLRDASILVGFSE